MTTDKETLGTFVGASSVPSGGAQRPAARAAARVGRVEVLLSVLGLASFGFVFLRLVETWRVSPHTVSHHIRILGQTLSYPVANLGAVVILVLALLGAVVTVMAMLGTGRELVAARRFGRRLEAGGRPHLDDVLVIDDPRPHAFCAGLLRPRVYVTSGALGILDERALDAVLLHERHHARRRDPLRLATSRVLAKAMFFLPVVRELGRRQQALAELGADESAVNAAPGNRSALAQAMLGFTDSGIGEADDSVGIDPARVDYLLGEPPSWRFPLAMCLAALAVLVLLLAAVVLVGREAAGSATLAPPFLSSQPCIVVLAVIPATVGILAVRFVLRNLAAGRPQLRLPGVAVPGGSARTPGGPRGLSRPGEAYYEPSEISPAGKFCPRTTSMFLEELLRLVVDRS